MIQKMINSTSAPLLPSPLLSAAFLLHEIAPYLPYKLKCQVKDKKKTVVAQLNAVYSDGSCTFHSLVESDKGFKEVKPILRPLHDMNKEIEHNGEKFIPMVVLCREYGRREPDNRTFNGPESSIVLMHADNSGGCKYWFVYHPEDMRFELSDDAKGMHSQELPQYPMFQKLFEWHFDVFGLIAKGQAVSKK